MSNLVPVKGKLPAAIAKLMSAVPAKEVLGDLSGGVVGGFPIISFRGKVWRVRRKTEEQNYVDDDGNAIQFIDVVLVSSNPRLSKTYYGKAYTEGDTGAPLCSSGDGVKPDAGVAEPQAVLCSQCPNNVWGSKTSNDGKVVKGRACSDVRRLAVVFLHELQTKEGDELHKFLLRIPPASLNPLKDYAEKVLAPQNAPYYAVVTRIGFDATAQFPKLTFKALRYLDDEEAAKVLEIRESDDVKRILAAADHELATPGEAPEPIAGTPPKAAAKPKATPVTEEDEEVPPPKPKAAAKKKAAPVEEAEEVEAEPAAPSKNGGIEDMISDLLGN